MQSKLNESFIQQVDHKNKEFEVDDTTLLKSSSHFWVPRESKPILYYIFYKKLFNCVKRQSLHIRRKGLSFLHSKTWWAFLVCKKKQIATPYILYAVVVSHLGNSVHIYSDDTDVLVLALQRVLDLNPTSSIIMVVEINNDSSNPCCCSIARILCTHL